MKNLCKKVMLNLDLYNKFNSIATFNLLCHIVITMYKIFCKWCAVNYEYKLNECFMMAGLIVMTIWLLLVTWWIICDMVDYL